jgi:hypothetical protein
VSTKGNDARLLDEWFQNEIQPLCERHQELAQQSLRRKIGALREAVEAVFRVRLELSEKGGKEDKKRLRVAETQLRKATGKFEEVKSFCFKAADEIRDWGGITISRAALEVAECWLSKHDNEIDRKDILVRNLTETAAEGANQIFNKFQALAQVLSRALAGAGSALEAKDVPRDDDLKSVIREMPRFDPGPLEVALRRDIFTVLGRRFTTRRIEKQLRGQIGPAVDEAFQRYGRMLESWSRRTLMELQRQFDAHADGYRAQLERLTGAGEAGPEEIETIRRDLETLSRFHSGQPVPATSGSA